MFIDLFIIIQLHITWYNTLCMHVLLLLLLDTVPGDIDIGDNDCDTVSEEATPISSVVSPATSFLPGYEGRQTDEHEGRVGGEEGDMGGGKVGEGER